MVKGVRLCLICATVVAALVACESKDNIAGKEKPTMTYKQRTADGWNEWARTTEMGLTIAVPPGRAVEVRAARIDLRNTSSYRTVDVISLYQDSAPPSISVGDGTVVGRGQKPAPFTVRENSGGSGGANYTLLTSKTVNGQVISLLAILETETDTPTFADAWAVWESLDAAQN